ncbi:DUF3750 domain-containing protein [Inmirania thermothiophila]|uniref:Uncharacterized protein DUF3750 n=1 Tax=Inmirania thermothiophila TaxID=1750597 RepID=A0A3N1Y1J7_9GAMM|nr:DUF3750 domain-containing protein [Inmirania thermothiophila]ROR32398.1 uncharacterized protein DUF3750 [Inmirania thermothiophila]
MRFALQWLVRLLGVLLVGPALALVTEGGRGPWWAASREPVGLAPDPAATPEAVVQVYGARAWGWRGAFGIHTWIAVKPRGAAVWTVHEVIGWRLHHGGSAVVTSHRPPDARWFGAAPEVLAELRGEAAAAAIPAIEAAVAAYPWPDRYRLWPGPNSNTFTAWVARRVPALRLDLPPTAVGKDYLGARVLAPAVSGTGWQLSLGGLLGLTLAREEGVEINLLGLAFGLDPADLALRLPGIGRVGP